MNANSLENLYREKHLLLSMDLEVLTPVFLGGHNPRSISRDEIETGLAKAFKALIWDWGSKIIATQKNKNSISSARRELGDILGWSGDGGNKSSRIYVTVEDKGINISGYKKGEFGIGRVEHLVRPTRYINTGRIRLNIYESPYGGGLNQSQKSLVINSLLLGLLLSGVGKATTRGFGKFWRTLINIKDLHNFKDLNFITQWNNLVSIICGSKDGAEYNGIDILDALGVNLDNGRGQNLTPIERLDALKWTVMTPRESDITHVLRVVNEAFLKSTLLHHSTVCRSTGKNRKYARLNCHTWIFGLPRARRIGDRWTGYLPNDMRHKSPFRVSVIKCDSSYKVLLYMFITESIYQPILNGELKWQGRTAPQGITLDSGRIPSLERLYNDMFNAVKSYLQDNL